MYKKINFTDTDSSKKNLLFICSQLETRKYTYAYVKPLIDVLSEEFNVYIILESFKSNIAHYNLSNTYVFDKKYWQTKIAPNLQRKKDFDDAPENNNKLIKSEINQFFKNEPSFHRIFIIDNHNMMLPYNSFTSMKGLHESMNDYFEYPNATDDERNEINRINEKLYRNVCEAFSPLTFMYYYKGVLLNTVHELYKKDKCRVEPIIIDATSASPFFKLHNIEHKFWYYTNDFRDGRNFHRFPFPEIQHLVYEKNYEPVVQKNILDDNSKTINFLFSGSLFNLKGTRKFIWKEFFKDFKYENSEIYFVDSSYSLPEEEMQQMKSEIYKHPSYKGDFMENKVFVNKLKQSKTSFIARSVQNRDGLTFRIFQVIDLQILPIFDYRYDPDYLQIPKKFQDILTVHNSEELIKVVDYYCTHENERIALISELQDYYKIKEWPKKWREFIKETDLYKELH